MVDFCRLNLEEYLVKKFLIKSAHHWKNLFRDLYQLTDIFIAYLLLSFMLINFGIHLTVGLFLCVISFLLLFRARVSYCQSEKASSKIDYNKVLQLRIILTVSFTIISCLIVFTAFKQLL